MTAKQIQWILAAVTICALVGIVILLALGKPVPAELYTFLGLGFGGHLALAGPPSGSGSTAATTLGLSELQKLIGLLPASPAVPAPATTAVSTSTAVPRAPSTPAAVTLPTVQGA